MTHMGELIRIVNGALCLDVGKVRSYTAFLAANLEREGDLDSARRLREALAGERSLVIKGNAT